MRRNVKGLVAGVALGLLLGSSAIPQEKEGRQFRGRARPGVVARRGAALEGLALRDQEFHIVSLRVKGLNVGGVIGAQQEGAKVALADKRAVGLLLFGTARYGVILEAPTAEKVMKGTIVALLRPLRPKAEGAKRRGRGRPPEALLEALEKSQKVGTLEFQLKPYEGRIVAVGRAEFAEGPYKGPWRLILFTRPIIKRPPRVQTPAAK